MNEKKQNYYVGLDLGTHSVGYAVIDSQYQLIKLKKRKLWGSRLFDEASSASNRRLQRSTRRRYNKRRKRIRLLKELMNNMVQEVDPTFFIRLENISVLDKEDKEKRLKDFGINHFDNYNLFIDEDFNDKTYYSKYPTIYHLRQHLMESKEKEDPRLIYLAIAHIIKYRGHFLFEGEDFNFNCDDNIEELLENHIHSFFNSLDCESFSLGKEQYAELHRILVSHEKTRNDKQKEMFNYLMNYFDKTYKPCISELTKAIVGGQFVIHSLFMDDSLKEEEIKLKFSDDFDSKCSEVSGILGERVDVLYEIKTIYDWSVLHDILGDNSNSLSHAMVKKFEKHGEDLKLLKKVIKCHMDKQEYKNFFNRSSLKGSYYNYIHHPNKCSLKQLYASINKMIEHIDSKDVDKIKNEIELEIFLPKQTSKDNSVIPYQLNKKELEIILENQSEFYEELRINKDKIIKLLEFKIPYYYGPLNSLELPNHWIVKQKGKEHEKILPWNHEEIVDVDQTAEKFITRMTSYCTYFTDQPVLPKNSLIVSKYEVLNELNKIKINGKIISVDLKNRIFEQLFLNKVNINENTLKKWLINQGEVLNDNIEISGFQKENKFASSLKPWIDFKKIFGEINQNNFEVIEQLIFDLTIFNDLSILKKRLKNKYNLSQNQIKQIIKLNYSGWSRLSRKLLWDIRTPNYKGKPNASIIDVLEMSNMNLMQIINNKDLAFKKIIEDFGKKDVQSFFTYDEIEQLQCSPANKKAIWQAVKIIDEIRKIMKCDPQGIYIEFAREEQNKTRTKSRKQQLLNLYKSLNQEYESLKEFQDLEKKLKQENDTFDERKFLYYTQLGKCMYSGKPLDYDRLSFYEIDHIIPRSLIKDDSIENKVLVLKKENQYKSDDLTIASSIRNDRYSFWKLLLDRHLITSKKFYNLTRTEFTRKNVEGFINRQLVETRQITKNVTQLLCNHLPETQVYAIRASLTHDFRMKNGFYKNRNLNDYHHAHDAYITCLLGLYIKRRYPRLENSINYALYQVLKKDKTLNEKKFGFVINGMDEDYVDEETGEVIWKKEFVGNVRKYLEYKDCYITKKLEEIDGELFKQSIMPNSKNSSNGKTSAKFPINKYRSSIEKYGGYTQVSSFMVAVEGEKIKKNKIEKVRVIEGIPLVYRNASLETQIQYLYNNGKKLKGLSNIRIIKVIKKNQFVEYDGGHYYLASSNEFHNAIQLLLSRRSQYILYNVNQALKTELYSQLQDDDLQDLYDEILLKIKKYYPGLSNSVEKLLMMKDAFVGLEINEKCKVLTEMLNGTSSGAPRGDYDNKNNFKLSAFGRLGSKTIYLDKAVFIDYSVTGFYERRYKL